MKKYSCILFDVDGTLIDTRETILKAMTAALEKCDGRELVPDALEKSLGIPVYQVFEWGILEAPDEDEFARQFLDNYKRLAAQSTRLFDGVREMLQSLKERGIGTGIVTSKEAWEYDQDMKALDVDQYFDLLVLNDYTKEHKPHPEPVLYFYNKTGIKAEDTLFVGDMVYDEQAAHAAHTDFAYAAWNGQPPIDNSDIILNAPNDVLNYVIPITE